MKEEELKPILDNELQTLIFDETMKRHVRTKSVPKRFPNLIKTAAVYAVIVMLGGTAVYAGYSVVNKIMVNDETLPALDAMHIIDIRHLKEPLDEYGMINENFEDYDAIQEKLGIDLLDSIFAEDNPYMMGELTTDNRDYLSIEMKNYILGDTSNYVFLPKENRYQYAQGQLYRSPISLNVDIILSKNQMDTGWEHDYLGMYRFVENYRSKQGYIVNIIEDTVDGKVPADHVSKKCAVFVADGIRYTLCGVTSIEEMKAIVDSMN